MSEHRLELLVRPREEDGAARGWEVLSPAVGLYAQAPPRGTRHGPGEEAGVLVILERVHRLVLPAGVAGFVATDPPGLRHQPVGYGDPLFVLEAGAEIAETAAALAVDPAAASGRVLRAPQAGRFYRKPDPESPSFAEEGDALQAGRTLGLLEVMKTFNPVKYQPGGGLPEHGRLARFLVGDGEDVEEGQPLLEVEDA